MNPSGESFSASPLGASLVAPLSVGEVSPCDGCMWQHGPHAPAIWRGQMPDVVRPFVEEGGPRGGAPIWGGAGAFHQPHLGVGAWNPVYPWGASPRGAQQASANKGHPIVGLDETLGGRGFHRLRYYGDLRASVSRTPMQKGEEHCNFHGDMELGAPNYRGKTGNWASWGPETCDDVH